MFGRDHGLIAALSRYLSGQTEETHQNSQDILCPSEDHLNMSYISSAIFVPFNFSLTSEYFCGYICYCYTVESRWLEPGFFEFPFRPSRHATLKAVSMLGAEFGCSVYFCMHMCFLGISLLIYSRFLCGFLCSVVQFKHVLQRTLTMKALTSVIFPSS